MPECLLGNWHMGVIFMETIDLQLTVVRFTCVRMAGFAFDFRFIFSLCCCRNSTTRHFWTQILKAVRWLTNSCLKFLNKFQTFFLILTETSDWYTLWLSVIVWRFETKYFHYRTHFRAFIFVKFCWLWYFRPTCFSAIVLLSENLLWGIFIIPCVFLTLF